MAKAGRKRKAGKREPNGRLAREPDRRISAEQDAMSVAVGYRQSVLGVKSAHVLDQKAGTLIGRLCLAGAIDYPAANCAALRVDGFDMSIDEGKAAFFEQLSAPQQKLADET